jgi:hypothetical protein
MTFNHPRRVRAVAIAFAAIVALSGPASPAVAGGPIQVRPTVDHASDTAASHVERRGAPFRARYQLRLGGATRLLGR